MNEPQCAGAECEAILNKYNNYHLKYTANFDKNNKKENPD
jgi:hypothetical protein